MRFTIAIICLLVTTAGLLTGCDSSGPPTGRVLGRVEFKQQPVPVGLVTFHSPESGVAASAKIQEGKFVMEEPLQVGSYSVYVSTPLPEPRDPKLGPPPPMPPVNIPPKAQDPVTSGITISVAKGSNDVKVELVE